MLKSPENTSANETHQKSLWWATLFMLMGGLGAVGLQHLLGRKKENTLHAHSYDGLTSAQRLQILLGQSDAPLTEQELEQLRALLKRAHSSDALHY